MVPIQIGVGELFPKNIFQAFFSKEKNLKKGFVDVHIRCLLSHFIFFMPFPFFPKDPLWQPLRNGKQRTFSALLKLSLWNRKITNYLKD